MWPILLPHTGPLLAARSYLGRRTLSIYDCGSIVVIDILPSSSAQQPVAIDVQDRRYGSGGKGNIIFSGGKGNIIFGFNFDFSSLLPR